MPNIIWIKLLQQIPDSVLRAQQTASALCAFKHS